MENYQRRIKGNGLKRVGTRARVYAHVRAIWKKSRRGHAPPFLYLRCAISAAASTAPPRIRSTGAYHRHARTPSESCKADQSRPRSTRHALIASEDRQAPAHPRKAARRVRAAHAAPDIRPYRRGSAAARTLGKRIPSENGHFLTAILTAIHIDNCCQIFVAVCRPPSKTPVITGFSLFPFVAVFHTQRIQVPFSAPISENTAFRGFFIFNLDSIGFHRTHDTISENCLKFAQIKEIAQRAALALQNVVRYNQHIQM